MKVIIVFIEPFYEQNYISFTKQLRDQNIPLSLKLLTLLLRLLRFLALQRF